MVVAPTRSLLLHVGRGPQAHLNTVENGLYVGVPLLVLLVATVFLAKRPGVLIAAGTIVVAIALQMYGSHWHVGERARALTARLPPGPRRC